MPQNLGHDCGEYLARVATDDQSIWVLDADLADSDGAEEFAKQHPERFISTGIAEQAMVSVAAGMASCGCRPWAFSFASFLCYRAYDQIRVSVSQTRLPVVLVGTHAGGCGGRNGRTHLALNDVSVMTTLPNIDVWAPADRADARFAVKTILNDVRPAYVRLPRSPQPDLPREPCLARWIGQPSDVAIASYGMSTQWALRTKKLLDSMGIETGVLHFLRVWPIARVEIDRLLRDVRSVFVIEDHYNMGGLADLLRYAGFEGRIDAVGWPSSWSGQSGSDGDLLTFAKLMPTDLAQWILSTMQRSPA